MLPHLVLHSKIVNLSLKWQIHPTRLPKKMSHLHLGEVKQQGMRHLIPKDTTHFGSGRVQTHDLLASRSKNSFKSFTGLNQWPFSFRVLRVHLNAVESIQAVAVNEVTIKQLLYCPGDKLTKTLTYQNKTYDCNKIYNYHHHCLSWPCTVTL